MAGRSDIQAGRAYVSMYVNKSGLMSSLNSGLSIVAKGAAASAAAITAVGTTATAAAIAAVNHFAASGDEINKMADRTGASVEALSELRYAAGQSGASLEDLEAAMRAVARKGGAGDPTTLLDEIADELAAIDDPTERAGRALELMGKSATKLLPLMNNGAAGVRALRDEARELGLSFDKTAADNATAFGDAWDRVKSALGGVTFAIGGALAPGLTNILDLVKQAIVVVSQWTRENAGLLQSFTDITGALAGGNFALVGSLAMESLTAAVLSGMSSLADLMGEGWGDVLGTLTTNSMEENWDLAVQGMTAAWDGFVAAITNAFTDAGNAVLKVWQSVTGFISDMIIENQQRLKRIIEMAAHVPELLGLVDAKQLATDILGPDVAAGDKEQAKDIARQQIASQADTMSAALEERRRAANQRAADSGREFGDGLAGGASRLDKAAADSRAQVARLMAEIKAAADRRTAAAAAVTDKPLATPLQQATSLVTYSASTLARSGEAGGVQGKMLKVQEDNKKLAERHLEEARMARRGIDRIATGLTFG